MWEETPLKNLQVLPKDALPIDNWPNEADAYVNIVRGIRKSISIIQDRRKHILAISLAEKREREGQYQADSEKEKQERELQMAAEKKTPKKHQNSIKPALQKAIQHKRFRFGVTAVISLLMLLLLGNQFGFFLEKSKAIH